MTNEELVVQAQSLLRSNDAGGFTKPSPTQYPHLWNWDSALIALGLAHFDLPRAFTEIRTLLSAQWRDGMVPHIIYPYGASDYFPPPEFWQTADLPHGGDVPSSGLTQPPVLATILRKILENAKWTPQNERGEGRDELAHFANAIFNWHKWLHTARDADGTGLPCLIHPWESGTDNSPRWLHALDAVTPRDLPQFKRKDMQHVAVEERPRPQDYERFVHLINTGRQLKWEHKPLLDEMPFLVQDAMFCALLHRADEDLLWLAQMLGLPKAMRAEIEGWMARTRAVFDARFWDEERGLYLDYDLRAGKTIPINTISTFVPLLAGLPDAHKAARLVQEHLRNSDEYAPGKNSAFVLPSAAKNEPLYAPRRYWCGPIWIQMNWLVSEGLRRYGYAAEADALVSDALTLIKKEGFREYYDPRDGSGCGAKQFSWSAALAIEMQNAK